MKFLSQLLCTLSIIFTNQIQIMAQTSLDGIYALQNVREMVAAFKFTPDGKFQFSYIYGASDRFANGTYTLEGNILKLKSDKKPGSDFTVLKQSNRGKGYLIELKAPQLRLVANVVRGLCIVGKEEFVQKSDDEGILHFTHEKCDKLYLQHSIFPDVLSLVKDESNENHHFVVELNEACMQVSFMGIDFTVEGDSLSCLPNYFMPIEGIRFVKQP